MPPQASFFARVKLELIAVTFAVSALGCTHTMEVRNLNQYSLSSTAPRSLRLSFDRLPVDEASRTLAAAVKDGLAAHSSVERVAVVGETPPDFQPDYVVTVHPKTQFDGSGWNYLVAFPGFLIFTHAWNGYVYSAQTTTEIEIRRPGMQDLVASRTVETDWNLRHCDFGRGAWTSSGWYTPFYGGLNLVVGFFMIQYDDGATAPFTTTVHDPYGKYIANHVVELLSVADARSEPLAPPPSPAPSDSVPPPAPNDALVRPAADPPPAPPQ